ncbi:MAG TPA: hypothetical protein DDY78_19480 [Planctomycetales bacterium]|jgi:hypothetical protein|nr:hypothetical protein [Planctomycetales bacterium]
MASPALSISFPPASPDPFVIPAVSGSPYALVVHGQADKSNKNTIQTATLTPMGGAAIQGVVRKQPKKWVVVFQIGSVVLSKPYALQIVDKNGPPATRNVQFKAVAAPVAHKILLDPQNGSTVDGSGFTASFPNPGGFNSAYAYMNQPGGPYYMGTPIADTPSEVFYFQDIPPGTDYTITGYVWANPPVVNSSSDITVT